MLHWALIFLVVAIIAAVFGFGGIAAGAAAELVRAHARRFAEPGVVGMGDGPLQCFRELLGALFELARVFLAEGLDGVLHRRPRRELDARLRARERVLDLIGEELEVD